MDHPREACVTDMDTAAGEGLRRRRGGGREGHARNAAPQQPPWAQPRMRYRPTEVVSADELESIHLGSLRVLDRDRDGLPRRRGARGPARRRRAVEPGSQRVRFDPDMVTELIKTAPSSFTLHARNPAHDLAARRRLDRLRDGRQPAQRRRPRPRPADRQPGRLPEPAPPGAVAQRRPLPGRLPGRAGRHPPRRPPPARDPRRADADGQADPLLQPRAPAQHRRPRDGAHRARRRRRDASTASRRSSRSSTRARRSGSTRRCSRAIMEFAGAQPGRRASRRSRWPARWRR